MRTLYPTVNYIFSKSSYVSFFKKARQMCLIFLTEFALINGSLMSQKEFLQKYRTRLYPLIGLMLALKNLWVNHIISVRNPMGIYFQKLIKTKGHLQKSISSKRQNLRWLNYNFSAKKTYRTIHSTEGSHIL